MHLQELRQNFIFSLNEAGLETESATIFRLLFKHYSGLTDVGYGLAFSENREISGALPAKMEAARLRILQNEPVQYIIGHVNFSGLTLKVGPGVLIPRPETEEMVFSLIKSMQKIQTQGGTMRAVDICSGSGCIAISLAHAFPQAEVQGIEAGKAAIRIAADNSSLNHTTNLAFIEHDALDPDLAQVCAGEYDIIVSNPPYVPESERAELAERVVRYEPEMALFVPDADPLVFYKSILHFAAQKLSSNGILAFECHTDFVEQVASLAKSMFKEVCSAPDFSGKPRFVYAGAGIKFLP